VVSERRIFETVRTRVAGKHHHVCRRYDDLPDFHASAREFPVRRPRPGHRVCYLASGDVDALVHDLRGSTASTMRCETARPQVTSLEATWANGLLPVNATSDRAAVGPLPAVRDQAARER
jgi:hypothetical protein